MNASVFMKSPLFSMNLSRSDKVGSTEDRSSFNRSKICSTFSPCVRTEGDFNKNGRRESCSAEEGEEEEDAVCVFPVPSFAINGSVSSSAVRLVDSLKRLDVSEWRDITE